MRHQNRFTKMKLRMKFLKKESVRSFGDKKIQEDDFREILEAAESTPSAGNLKVLFYLMKVMILG